MLNGWQGKPPLRTSTRPLHSVKSVFVMSWYSLDLGNQYRRTCAPKGFISQWKRFSQPIHEAASSAPPMPLNSDAWVMGAAVVSLGPICFCCSD